MIVPIDSAADGRVERYIGLRDHRAQLQREGPGGDRGMTFLAEGVTVIERALTAGHELLSILADHRDAFGLDDGLGSSEVPIYAASPAVLEVVCGRPRLRDPIACFVRPELLNARAVLAAPTMRTIVVLEGIVNPTNMGVIARCAAGLGIDAILLDPGSADPLYRRAVRVSMGEVFAIPHARIEEIPGGFDPIREAGFDLVALSPAPGADDIDEVERSPGDKLAIVLGTEGAGLSDAAMAGAGRRVRIPMTHGVDSINVGSAAAVAFHALRA